MNSQKDSAKMEKTNGYVPCKNSVVYGSLAQVLFGDNYKRSQEKKQKIQRTYPLDQRVLQTR